jgi:hypothetical protein
MLASLPWSSGRCWGAAARHRSSCPWSSPRTASSARAQYSCRNGWSSCTARFEGERDDGEKEDDLIPAFRWELRAALLVATEKGFAEMLAVAGRPFPLKGGAQGSHADPVSCPPVARVASASLAPRTAPPHGQVHFVACDGFTASR